MTAAQIKTLYADIFRCLSIISEDEEKLQEVANYLRKVAQEVEEGKLP